MKQEKLIEVALGLLVFSLIFVVGVQFFRVSENNLRYSQCRHKQKNYARQFCSSDGAKQDNWPTQDADIVRIGTKNTYPEMYLIRKEIEKLPGLEAPRWTGLNHFCNFDFIIEIEGPRCRFLGAEF